MYFLASRKVARDSGVPEWTERASKSARVVRLTWMGQVDSSSRRAWRRGEGVEEPRRMSLWLGWKRSILSKL